MYRNYEEFLEKNKDLFTKHKVEIIYEDTTKETNNVIISFKDPITSNGAMTISYIDGYITINGDYGTSVYTWYNGTNHILAHMNFGFSYSLEKLVAVDGEKQEFSYDMFVEDLEEVVGSLRENDPDLDLSELNMQPSGVEDIHSMVCWARDNRIFNEIDDVYDYGVYSLGLHLHTKIFIRWMGFQEALKQYENTNKYIITFGVGQLVGIHPNPNSVMLIVTGGNMEDARQKVFDSKIGKNFFTSYRYNDEAERFKEEFDMVEYTMEELLGEK